MTVHDTMPAVIGLDHVQALGTVDESLGSFYDRALEEAVTDAVSEREIRDWVESELISEHGFRSQALEGPGRSGAEVLLALENAYLIRSDMRRGAQWFELAHDRLVGPVRQSNEAWRTTNLSALQVASLAWERQGRPEALLVSGTALAAAGAWAESNPGALLPTDVEFLDASDVQERGMLLAQKATRRNRLMAGVAFVLALLAIIGGLFAYRLNQANNVAEDNADEANRQQQIAEANAGEAKVQQGIAEASTSKAESNEQKADKSARAAEDSAQEASDSAIEATRQQQIAEEQQGVAEEQQIIAEEQQSIAEEQQIIAEEQQIIAEANAAEATNQRRRAEANATEATNQRRRAEANATEATNQRVIAEANAAEATNQRVIAETIAADLAVVEERTRQGAICIQDHMSYLQRETGSEILRLVNQGDLEGLRAFGESVNGPNVNWDTAFVCGVWFG